jgi:hypothetical protein
MLFQFEGAYLSDGKGLAIGMFTLTNHFFFFIICFFFYGFVVTLQN